MPISIKVVDIELSQPLHTLEGLEAYGTVQGLVRWQGVPLGWIHAPVTAGRCEAVTLSKLISEQYAEAIAHQLLVNRLATPLSSAAPHIEELLRLPSPQVQGTLPLVTVAVCTRDRASELSLCLDALTQIDYPALDLLVIDNAPTSDATQQLVERYPSVRYVCEPRPGLDWARNRGILEAKGDIVAYTDDDVVVDAGWVKAIAAVFAENPKVMAVTGLVVPYELETEAQALFEQYGGFGRGFDRQWYHVSQAQVPWRLLGTGQFGTGANMAYRHTVFAAIGGFDPALDVGTVTNGGGDLEMFFRVLKSGHTLVYEPRAIVRHRHRRDYDRLRTQIANNGSLYAYFLRSALAYPDQRLSFLWLGLVWMGYWNVRRLLISLIHPTRFPRDLIWAELWGGFVGMMRYPKAQKTAAAIAASFPDQPILPSGNAVPIQPAHSPAVAVRTVELTQPLVALSDLADAWKVRVFVTWNQSPLASFDLVNQYQSVSVMRLSEAIAANLGFRLLDPDRRCSEAALAAAVRATITQHLKISEHPAQLAANLSVSVIVGTFDRPDELRNCLRGLVGQVSSRSVEVIVVDNHPASGLTPPVVAQFPGVKLVSESRQGVAYARNAGIVHSLGDLIVTTDDDVTLPPNWLENLIAPFGRSDVMAVTGNVLPLELKTEAQQLFEQYGNGGLGRGFERFEVDGDWFERSHLYPAPTWELGGTANSAFRASLFADPRVGLMAEPLGPGMPSGVGEDIYLFYKILKAGYRMVYEPTACVWHQHRRDRAALQRQLYNYSKGFVSYQLTTLLQDGDLRALFSLLIVLPLYHLKRIGLWLGGNRSYPLSLIWVEIAGNLAGAWSLWRSHQRVQRQGRSAPYIPVAQRQAVALDRPTEPAPIPVMPS